MTLMPRLRLDLKGKASTHHFSQARRYEYPTLEGGTRLTGIRSVYRSCSAILEDLGHEADGVQSYRLP